MNVKDVQNVLMYETEKYKLLFKNMDDYFNKRMVYLIIDDIIYEIGDYQVENMDNYHEDVIYDDNYIAIFLIKDNKFDDILIETLFDIDKREFIMKDNEELKDIIYKRSRKNDK